MTLLTFSTNVKANNHLIDVNTLPDINKPVVPVKQGETVPFDGLLFSEQKAESTRLELLDKDACFKDKDSLNKEIDLYKSNISFKDQQVNMLLNQNKVLIEVNNTQEVKDEIKKYVYFGSGILITILSVYASSKITK